MQQKQVKVKKDGITKTIYEKDLADFVAVGWVLVQENENPYSTYIPKK